MSDNTAPIHLGIILDGNRRWAKSRGLKSIEGHKQGYENLKEIVEAAFKQGVRYVSAYVFSTENWKRSDEEVSYLMNLILWVAKNEINELNKRKMKILFVGEDDRLPATVLKAMRNAEEKTKDNTKGVLLICLNYGGQQEIASAVNDYLLQHPGATNITPKDIENHLYYPEIPPIDLIIRTSGEQRLSNFMLWRAAYSEFFFSNKHWPDFTPEDLGQALEVYAGRNRRFGGDHTSAI